jgi:hypothetical protein
MGFLFHVSPSQLKDALRQDSLHNAAELHIVIVDCQEGL